MSKKHTSASTSNADKVIDALTEVRKEQTAYSGYVCSNCGSKNYSVRSPVGGPKIKVCGECNSKSFTGGHNIAPLLASKNPHNQGSTRGPIRSQPKPKADKHQPTYRSKGKKR